MHSILTAQRQWIDLFFHLWMKKPATMSGEGRATPNLFAVETRGSERGGKVILNGGGLWRVWFSAFELLNRSFFLLLLLLFQVLLCSFGIGDAVNWQLEVLHLVGKVQAAAAFSLSEKCSFVVESSFLGEDGYDESVRAKMPCPDQSHTFWFGLAGS